MNLQREASLGIGAILVLQILLSMFTIALLTRMGPAIEQILEENVYSSIAVENMMAVLATHSTTGPVPKDFDAAFGRARNNVTEDLERAPLAVIEREHQAAFAGDPQARVDTITALQELGQINFDSMVKADAKAKRLGQAGAWAAALLGAVALALGILMYRRLRLRLGLPIEELRHTMARVRAGNVQARCLANTGPLEVKQIAQDLNWMLDRWLQEANESPHLPASTREAEIRRALLWVLDQEDVPLAILDAQGKRISANRAGMALEESLDSSNTERGDERWQVEEIPGTSLQFARLSNPAS